MGGKVMPGGDRSAHEPVSEARTDDDHDAVCACSEEHVVVSAPPGTGKTFLSIRLAGTLSRQVEAPAQVLLLTFSCQARAQLEEEARRQLSPAARRRITISNYHRFFWSAVSSYCRALGLPLKPEIVSQKNRNDRLRATNEPVFQELRKHAGLLEAFAEFEFHEFRDERLSEEIPVEDILPSVHEEHAAGRLVFDDLGALFWKLLESFPAVAEAYSTRYPIVIADEHQDASALQDAIVRRLGRKRLVVFADPMQLIHGFRGASPERLQLHIDQCGGQFTLGTPHRWHHQPDVGDWLLAVRDRLQGVDKPAQSPDHFLVETYPSQYGLNALKGKVKVSVLRAFERGCKSIAVLMNTNTEVWQLQNYLCSAGLFPKRVGSAHFEECRTDIEQLPLIQDSQGVALHLLDRLESIVPTLADSTLKQVRQRTGPDSLNTKRAGTAASRILTQLAPLYEIGPKAYLDTLAKVVADCEAMGHHLPRRDAVWPIQQAAHQLTDESDFESMVNAYASSVAEAAHRFTPIDKGLFVMTAHQAKGREFDAVVIANGSERFYSDSEDDKRLFYVAITRATRDWTIIRPDNDASPLIAHCT